MALILNPNIEDINQLLTNEQIETSKRKRIIQTRMKEYPPFKQTQQKIDILDLKKHTKK